MKAGKMDISDMGFDLDWDTILKNVTGASKNPIEPI